MPYTMYKGEGSVRIPVSLVVELSFLPRDAMLVRPLPSYGVCLPVCPFVRLSVRLSRSYILSKLIKISSKKFSPSGSHTMLVFRTRCHGNIPTATLLTEASNAGVVGRNRNSEPISGFIACCQRCDRLGVINMAPLNCGKL